MRPSVSEKQPTKARRLWRLLVGVGIVLGAGLLVLLFAQRPERPAHTSASTLAPSYKNRALIRRTSPGAHEETTKAPTIQGNVYDTMGSRVSGATIVATTYDIAGNVPTTAGSTRTDDHGRFEISLQPGTYQLAASKKGYGPTASLANTGQTISLVLPKTGIIQGHVYDDKGKPQRTFSIELVSFVPGEAPVPPPIWSGRFDTEDGAYNVDQIPDWPVLVRATAEGFAPAFSQPIIVKRDKEQTVDLHLSPGCVLTGRVEDKKGAPIGHVFVDAEARVAAGSMSDTSYDTDHQTESDDDGAFRFDHVPMGTLLVRGYDGENAVSTVTTEIKDCAHTTPVTVVMSKGGSIRGIARKPDNSPLAGARVTVTERSVGFINVITDAKGAFKFDDLPPTLVRLELEHEGRRALQFVMVKEGDTVEHDLVLFGSGEGEIRGRVTAGQTPLAGLRVMVASNHGRTEGIDMFFPVTGDDGTFRLPKVPVGKYLTSVMSSPKGKGIEVKTGQVTDLELDVGAVRNDQATPHLRRVGSPE